MDIGASIKRFRKQLNMKQKDLADILHVSPQAVSSWEINRTQPNMEMIEAMCLVFGCKKSDFLSEPIKDSIIQDLALPSGVGDDIPKTELLLSEQEIVLVNGFRSLSLDDKHMLFKLLRLMTYARAFSEMGEIIERRDDNGNI